MPGFLAGRRKPNREAMRGPCFSISRFFDDKSENERADEISRHYIVIALVNIKRPMNARKLAFMKLATGIAASVQSCLECCRSGCISLEAQRSWRCDLLFSPFVV